MSYHKRDHFKDKTQKEYTCGKYQCIYTTNRSKLFQSAAVLFTNGYAKQNDLPGSKLPGQRWVMVNHESPANGRFHSFLSGKINWTLTYHRSSDLLYPYGFYRRRGSDIHYPWEVGTCFVDFLCFQCVLSFLCGILICKQRYSIESYLSQ